MVTIQPFIDGAIYMDLRPIKSRRIYEEIIEHIKRLIADGDLKPCIGT